MTVRHPLIESLAILRQNGEGPGHLEQEILAEKASALGRAGRRVEAALASLESCEDAARPAALAEASRAVHAYFIQRELCGLRRHADVIREYRIPTAILARLGAD